MADSKYMQMLRPTPPAAAQQTAPAGTGSKYMQMLGGQEAPPQGEDLSFTGPRAVDASLEGAASPASQAVASFADEPLAKIRFYAKRRGLPIDRYGVVGGDIVYKDDAGKLHAEEPDTTWNPATWPAQMSRWSGDMPSLVGGGAGAVGGTILTANPLGGAAGAAAGAAGGEALRQWGAEEILGDPFDMSQVGAAGLGGALGEFGGLLIARGMSSAIARRAAGRVSELLRKGGSAVAALRQAAKEQGITLTPAELTNLTKLRGEQRALSALPQSAGVMDDFYALRGQQVQSAADKYFSTLSTVDNPELAGEMGRGAAKGAIEGVRQARSAAAEPLYASAYAANPAVDSPVIRQVLGTPAGKKAFAAARDKMLNDRVPPGDFELRTLDYVKRAFGDMEQSALQAGNRDDARIIGDLRRAFVKEVDALDATASGAGGGDYAKARSMFGSMSDPVTRAEGGVLAGATDVADPKLGDLSYKLFTGAGPDAIGKARVLMTATPSGEAAWNANLRAFLEGEFTKASKVAMSNISKPQMAQAAAGPRWWASMFGDLKQQARLKAAMSPDQFAGLKKLMDVLEATGRAMDFNSDTAFKQEAIREMRRTAGGGMGGAATAAADPLNAVRLYMPVLNGLYKDFRFGKNVEKLAQVITDPNNMELLSTLRTLSPTSKKAVITAATMLGISAAGQTAGFFATRPQDQMPYAADPGARLPALR